ncbi:DUF4115 domain-containing protein [Azospirillum sp. ST 5-10]|uniref:DUF4115 domain-containing protein n=1 Tax=unclassified Azospirillum TaxID=2630922 RepID=UPI003F4A0F8A
MVDLVPALPDRLVSLLDNLPFSSTTQPQLPPAADGGADTPAVVAEADPAAGSEPVPAARQPAPEAPPSAAPPSAAPPSAAPPPAAATPASPPAAPAEPPPVTVAAAPEPPPAPAAGGATATPAPAVPAPAVPTAGPAAANPPPAAAPVPIPQGPAGEESAAGLDDDEAEGPAQEPTPLSPAAPALPAVAATPGSTAAADAAAAAAAPPTRVYGTQNQESRIQLRATQDSWVQVRDGKGELLFTRVLRPGDVYRVPDRPGVRLRTGNAGGLIVIVDGVAGTPLGASGQVLRDVALDAPALR